MTATSELQSHPDRTRGLIEAIAGGRLGAALRAQVAARHPETAWDEVDEAFQEACLRAAGRCHGRTEGEVFVWLRTTTQRELAHRRRRARRELLLDLAAPEFQLAAVGPAPEQVLFEAEVEAEVDRVTEAVLERLSERQRQVVALHSRGRPRAEIAARLGMTPRSVKRAIERTMAQGRDELIRLAGNGCDAGEPVVARLAFGLASARERGQAQAHLVGCTRCGALYERLDRWREKVVALLPLPVVEQTHPGAVERSLQGAVDTAANVKQKVADAAGTAREQLVEGVAHAKHQATSAYARALDPTPLAGVRPGAAAAALAGCIALGGGATYCVERGIDPTRPFGGLGASERRAPRARHVRAAPTVVPIVSATPVPLATAQTTPSPEPVAQPTPTPTPTPAPPLPAEEYEPVAPAPAPAPAPAQTQTPALPSSSSPASAGGPGEFDGP